MKSSFQFALFPYSRWWFKQTKDYSVLAHPKYTFSAGYVRLQETPIFIKNVFSCLETLNFASWYAISDKDIGMSSAWLSHGIHPGFQLSPLQILEGITVVYLSNSSCQDYSRRNQGKPVKEKEKLWNIGPFICMPWN